MDHFNPKDCRKTNDDLASEHGSKHQCSQSNQKVRYRGKRLQLPDESSSKSVSRDSEIYWEWD